MRFDPVEALNIVTVLYMSLSNLINRMHNYTIQLPYINKQRLATLRVHSAALPIVPLLVEQTCIFQHLRQRWHCAHEKRPGTRSTLRLFPSRSVINCSVFTLHALLNTDICLDGVHPVCRYCLSRAGAAADSS